MKKNGIHTEFHENGKKKSEGNYKGVDRWNQPQKIGKWTGWHENGKKKLEGTFTNGELDGLVIEWHDNGQKTGI